MWDISDRDFTLFVGYRDDAGTAHLSRAPYLKKRLGHYLSATAY